MLYIYIYIYVYTHTSVYTYMYIYIYVYYHIYMCSYIHIYIYIFIFYTCIHIYTYMFVYIYIHIYIYIYTHVYSITSYNNLTTLRCDKQMSLLKCPHKENNDGGGRWRHLRPVLIISIRKSSIWGSQIPEPLPFPLQNALWKFKYPRVWKNI